MRMTFCAWKNDINCKTKREAHTKAKAEVQHKTRELEQMVDWESTRTPTFCEYHDTRGFFTAINAVYGPACHGMNPFHSKDGTTLLKDNEAIHFHRKEHFEDLFNHDPMVTDELSKSPNNLLGMSSETPPPPICMKYTMPSSRWRTKRQQVQMGSCWNL